MMPTNDWRTDPSEAEVGPIPQHLYDDLSRVYRSAAAPPRLDTAVAEIVRAARLVRSRPQPHTQWLRWLHLHPRVGNARRLGLATLAAALLLVLSGTAGYWQWHRPTPVSAQTVLRHAAALQLGPSQAAHLIYIVSMAYGGHAASGTADVWLQTDAGGAAAVSAQTLTLHKLGVEGAATMSSRFIQVGQQILAYNPELRGDNTILLSAQTQTRAYPSWVVPNGVFDGGGVAQTITALAQKSPQQVRLLPEQTLDGVLVDAIEVDGWTERPAQRTTLYFDARSYVLRGFDASSLDPTYPMPSWQARLSSTVTMAAAAVPPGTFALDAPVTASIAPFDLGGPAFSSVAAVVTSLCHSGGTTPSPNGALKALLRSGQSLIAACQATAPGVTAADLVAALAVPYKATLDAGVAAGVLTSEQAGTYLSQLQAQLTAWITSTPNPSAPAATSDMPSK